MAILLSHLIVASVSNLCTLWGRGDGAICCFASRRKLSDVWGKLRFLVVLDHQGRPVQYYAAVAVDRVTGHKRRPGLAITPDTIKDPVQNLERGGAGAVVHQSMFPPHQEERVLIRTICLA